mmetsp:Transcript_72038/g.206773  ORF Transcript_72038/g.206773 Transcript_72038/m.206773 type:complete len:387 (-) Transcript_72038:73-1233(-)
MQRGCNFSTRRGQCSSGRGRWHEVPRLVIALGAMLLCSKVPTAWVRPTGLVARGAGAAAAAADGAQEGAQPFRRVVAVAGATGRTGRLVVQELLRSGRATEVCVLVRNETKASEVLPLDDARLRVVLLGSDAAGTFASGCEGVDAAIWCSDGQDGIVEMARLVKDAGDASSKGAPRMVMCSSAAITRPTWPKGKQSMFPGVADIPIVRLNPGNLLGKKRAAEALVRTSGAPYVILRPTGLRDDSPVGRPLLSQGDFAVGRTSRVDLASMLVALLDEPSSTGKTVEMLSVAGYPKPVGYASALAPLLRDAELGLAGRLRRGVARLLRGGGASAADEAKYGLLQQLLPGENQDSASLAMGQTYEQNDKGQEGRLGPRGEERVPASMNR